MTLFSTRPQSFVQELSQIPEQRLKMIGKNGCLAFCYLRCIGIDSPITSLQLILSAMDKQIISEECYVNDGEKFLNFASGRKWRIEKTDDISKIKSYEVTPVFYTVDGKNGHWVCVYKNEIVFNPLNYSLSVEHGTPQQARLVSLVK